MKLINKNINVITMKYPSSWHKALWREGLVSGNGKIGANVYGGTKRESVLINHSALWTGTECNPLPDISGSLTKTRQAMDNRDFNTANWILTNALTESGYNNERGYPLPLAELNMSFTGFTGFSDYLRAVNMETGEVSSQFREKDVWVKKDLFVSRKDDMILLRIQADKPFLDAVFSLDVQTATDSSDKTYQYVKEHSRTEIDSNIIIYKSLNTNKKPYGAAVKIESADGDIKNIENRINVNCASDILIKIKVFVNGCPDKDKLKFENNSYEYYLNRHIPLHSALYHSAELNLFENNDLSNEELMLKAYSGKSPNELIEKLWRYGRYLFISGSSKDGFPFSMYGLWCGDYKAVWSHNMANENIQMMYWHTNIGNLEELNKALLDYYISRLDSFKECAKKLYGCNGIFIPAGTTPNMPLPCQLVPVIINWTGAAGWLAQYYYKYYSYTGDTEYLHSVVLPFMKAAADFYEDFIVFDKNGHIKIYPSVSPENSPLNFIPKDNVDMAHPMTSTVNSTMDLAIIKELFTNLIELCVEHNIYGNKIKIWEKIVNSIPEYSVNKDGAVKEWQDDDFEDRYYHRHLSHIYPVFPGDEITTNDDMVSVFEKAVDLRDISAQTGWSQAHMASIYARFNRGNDAMDCLNNLVRSCMQTNFFTLHNDWRRMDLSLEMDSAAPIQLDASMGYVNAVQEMILYSSKKLIKLLPALSDNMQHGKITGWRFEGGTIDMEWNIPQNEFKAELTASKTFNIIIELPPFCANNMICNSKNIISQNGRTVEVKLTKGDKLILGNSERFTNVQEI